MMDQKKDIKMPESLWQMENGNESQKGISMLE